MCGIFGVIAKNEKRYTELITNIIDKKKFKILENLAPRGPNSNGDFYDEKCYFLTTRLRICDDNNLSDQPFISDGIILIFNGEIYNHADLREQLIEKNYHFKTLSDTEVIIQLYKDEGISFVDKLIGIFSFCLYDTKQRNVFLFRDRLGVKPLFYHENDDVVIFSSDIPSILECVDVCQRSILPMSISSYLSFRNVIGENTFFDKIKKLTPGKYMLVHRSMTSIQQYWTLDTSNIDTVPDIYDSIDFLRKNLQQAIQRNISSSETVNIFLSGGLDSSAIVYFADSLIKQGYTQAKQIKTYSIGFDSENEFDYANIVADKFQTDHTNIITNTDEYVENMIDLILFKGEPLNVPNEPLISTMAKRVKENGDVVLSGEGADELLHGYGRLFISYYNYLNDTSVPFFEYFMKNYTYISDDYKKSLLEKNVWEHDMKEDEQLKYIFNTTFNECNGIHNQDKIGYAMLKLHLPCLLARLDNATMSASVEGRVPFLDHDIVEYCFYRIQREHKIKLLKDTSLSFLMDASPKDVSEKLDSPKFILKEMLTKDLPIDVIMRKKIGFTVPIERILFEKLEVITRMLESGYINKLNIFDLSELLGRFKKQTYQQYDVFTIWMLMNLEIFSQLFIYNIPISDVKTFFLVDPQYKYEKGQLIEKILLRPDEQLQRYIKLYIIKSLFEKYDVEYFAYGGTMLGCVRHQGYIPWDDDIDLMILEEQCAKITEELRMELLYAGFQIKKTPEGYKIFDFTDKTSSQSFFVDVFVAKYDCYKTSVNYSSPYFLKHFPGREIDTDDLFPLVEYKFGFFTLMGMKNPENYFAKCKFGDYMRCAIISALHNKQNDDLLHAFLDKYGLENLLLRDTSLLTYKDDVTYTDDWKHYFNRVKEYIPPDFNPHNYHLLNKDLTSPNYSDVIELYIHYINYGRHENRIYNTDSVLPIDFDVRGYRCMNPDIANMTDQELRAHYVTIGKDGKRQYNIRSSLPFDFNAETYQYLNPDLDNLNEDKLIYHFIHAGKSEKRYYTTDGLLPTNFDYKRYIALNSDLSVTTERDAIIHYIKYGRKENRNFI